MQKRSGNTKNGNEQNITLDQVEALLKESPEQADKMRGAGLVTLSHVKRAKLVQCRRERVRLEARYGKDHPRVLQADDRMRRQHHQLVNTRAEADRSNAPIVERSATHWVLHGYVRSREGLPVAKAEVMLFPDKDGYQAPLAQVTTDSKGYYTFCWAPDGLEAKTDSRSAAESNKHTAEKSTHEKADTVEVRPTKLSRLLFKRPANNTPNAVYLGAEKSEAKSMDCRSLYPAPGTLVYRDIELDVAQSDGCQLRTRYLGNSSTRELHDLHNEKSACKIAAMRPDHRVYFVSQKQAAALGYDFCAKCYGKHRSTR